MCWLPPGREAGRAGQGSGRELVYTVMLGASFNIFCSPACLKESCLKTIPPPEVFLIRTTCSQVSPGLDLPGKGVPRAPEESRSCCPQEEERKPWSGCPCHLDPLLSKGVGSCTEPALGTPGRRRRSREGTGAVSLPRLGAPCLAAGQKSADKAGPEPRGGRGGRAKTETGLGRMLLSSLTGCPPFPQGIKRASPKKHAFSHPAVSPERQQTSAGCQQAASCPASSQAGPRSSQLPPGPPPRHQPPALLLQQGLGSTRRDLRNVKVAVNSICVHCGVGASKKKKKERFPFGSLFFFFK